MDVADLAVREADAGFLDRWRALAASALEPNPFLEPELAVAAATHLEGGEADRVVAVQDGTRLVAAVVLRPRPRYRRVPVPALQAWGHQHAYLDTPLVAPDAADPALGALLDHLREQRREAWLVAQTMPAEGPVHDALLRVLRERSLRPTGVLAFERPVIHRRPEPTYLDGRLSSRRRKELRRQRRRLGADAATVDLAAAGDSDAAIDEFLALEASGWKGGAGTALASRPGDAAFFRAAMHELAQAGRAHVWALRGEDGTAAMACGVVAGDTLFHLKIAYDESLSSASPGTLLELDLIDAFHADPRVARLDPCTPAGPSPSERLYPERRRMHTLLVPLSRVRGRAAARSVRMTMGLRQRLSR